MSKRRRTRADKKVIEMFDFKNDEELTQLYLKSDVIFISWCYWNFQKRTFKEFDFKLLYCVGLPGYTWRGGLKCTDIKGQTLQVK